MQSYVDSKLHHTYYFHTQPTLKAQDGTTLSTGADYITNAPLVNAIA